MWITRALRHLRPVIQRVCDGSRADRGANLAAIVDPIWSGVGPRRAEVVEWLNVQESSDLYVTAITLGEIS